MRAFDRDLIRGGHYGQRSCEPHTGRTHGCTDPSLRREESPCQLGAVHTWHEGKAASICCCHRTTRARPPRGTSSCVLRPTTATPCFASSRRVHRKWT